MAWNALLATRNSDLFNSFNCFSQQMEFIVLVCLKWCWLKAVNSSDACIEHYSYDNKMFYLWIFSVIFIFLLFLSSVFDFFREKKKTVFLSFIGLIVQYETLHCMSYVFFSEELQWILCCMSFSCFVGFPVIILLKACSHQLTFYNWFLWLLFGQFSALLAMQQLIANIWDIFSLPCNHG